MQTLLPLLLPVLIGASSIGDDPVRFMHQPHVNGNRIAFCYHGDIWLANDDGSSVKRLTNHLANDTHPRFSPDGKWIAFSSNRMGNDDIWVIPVTGGAPKQITYHTTGDTMCNWTPDGKHILFASSRSTHPFLNPLYSVPVAGGIPVPLDIDTGSNGMIRQDGQMLAFNRQRTTSTRKHYKGNRQTDIWVQDLRSTGKPIRQLTDIDTKQHRSHMHDAYPMWGKDGKIYFASERSGIFNIWRIDAKGGQPEQVTKHAKDGVQNPSISADGSTLIYENDFELWKLAVPGGQPERIEIRLAFEPKENTFRFITTSNTADGLSPAPDGSSVAVDYHGEIFLVPANAKRGEKSQVTSSGWRERYQKFSPDGKFIAYVSDRSHEEEIWVYELATKTHRQLSKHESTKRSMVWSPDSKKIVFDGANELVLVDVATGKATKLGYNVAGGYSVSEFSRDGKWLVLTKSDADRNSDVYLHEIATGTQHNVTKHPARDSGGRLTPDGKTVVFTSRRNGESSQLFAVSLKKLTKDPKDPLNQPARRSRTSRRGGRGARPEGGGSADRSIRSSARNTTPLTIAIDADDIDRRAVALTPSSGSVGSYFLSRDGKTVYYTAGSSRFGFGRRRSEVKEPNLQRRRRQRPTQTPTQRPTQRPTQTPSPRQTRGMPGAQSGSSGSGLWSVGLDGDNRKKVTDGSFRSLAVTPDKSAVFFSDREGIYKLALSTRKKEQVKFELKVKVDNHAEWEQVFEESWRSMKYRFYDKDMHGFDWDAIKARYKPYLAYVGSNEDLSQLANEMIGELNASHVGVRSSPSRSMDRVYQTRLLGFEMSPGAQHYTVSHIYRDGPSDKEWIDLANGDQVLAMNGQPVAAGDNYWKILNETLNDYVTVRIARNGKEHNIRVRPTTSLSNIKYREWVHQNTKFVEKETAGEIAYCHIRSMSQTSLRQFEREISQYWNKKGIVIDIRYNGGGNIDEPLLDILERRPYAYVNQRWGARTWGRRHSQTVAGPKVMMINERSFSDAEMTPMGFKNLELGRLVGTPTGAGVIWTGSYRLINGSRIRTPGSLAVTYDPSKPNNYGINLENFGVEPDVWVENSPRDELDGNDRQLKAAIAEVRRMLGKGSWQHATHQGNGANDRK